MPLSTSPVVTEGDISHKFQFDPSFESVHLHSDCELRFFCEAFSLIDSMRNLDLLHEFVQKLRRNDGKLTCHDITSVLRQGNLIELSEKSTGDDGLNFLLNNLYNVVDEIVHDKFVTCMHASTLGCSAWEIGDLYLEKLNQPDSSEDWSHLKEKSSMWKALAVRLQDLAKFQHKSIKIHHDFQKSNYAPDPRAKYAYGSTIFISVAGFLYMCLKNLTCMDPNEFIHLT